MHLRTSLGAALALALAACGGSQREVVSADAGPGCPHGHCPHGHGPHGHGPHGHGGHAMPHRFERAEDWVAAFDDPARDAWQKPAEVVQLAAITPGMHVADIGAGTGYFLPHLSRAVGAGGVVHALDVEPDMVRHMTERAQREGLANVRARQIAADDPGLAAGSLDRILVVDTWHHIDARVDYSKKLLAGLKPGGRLLVVDFTLESAKGPPATHRIAPEQVVAELTQAGFRAEIVAGETLPDQYVVVGHRP